MIFMLEIFLQSSVIMILLGLCLWVLFLVLLTSPLWIPLSICWAPAALLTFLILRYTQAGEKAIEGAERVFYYLLYKQAWVKKYIWKNIYNLFSW